MDRTQRVSPAERRSLDTHSSDRQRLQRHWHPVDGAIVIFEKRKGVDGGNSARGDSARGLSICPVLKNDGIRSPGHVPERGVL